MKKSECLALLGAAVVASRKAYAPYSKFHVGAALLAEDGEVFTGCNVENASYGLTICAERNAVFHAVARGTKTFKAVAIVANGKAIPFPCGACRQVLAEFCGPKTVVLIAGVEAVTQFQKSTLGALLPKTFRF
jgi:cytidine deaminase